MWSGIVDHHPADQVAYYHVVDHSVRNSRGDIYDWGVRVYLYAFDAITHAKLMLFKDAEVKRGFIGWSDDESPLFAADK